jgi:hypothetical protein
VRSRQRLLRTKRGGEAATGPDVAVPVGIAPPRTPRGHGCAEDQDEAQDPRRQVRARAGYGGQAPDAATDTWAQRASQRLS